MASRRTACRALACALTAMGLSGCLSDRFASRAVQYNLMSEQAHNGEMLLNIVRASQRRPLEFTALQSITGTGSAEAQLQLDLPIAQNGDTQSTILSPRINLSARPTFTVSVLDTQEFYQGILKPLTLQTFDFYLKRGLSRRLLYDLFFSSISVTVSARPTDEPSFIADFDNDVADDAAFDDYQRLIELLLGAGLTTTTLKPPSATLGPPLTPEESLGADLGGKAAAGGFALKAIGWCDLSPAERHDTAARLNRVDAADQSLTQACAEARRRGGSGQPDPAVLQRLGLPWTLYRLEKAAAGSSFSLCFEPPPGASNQPLRRETTCGGLQRRADADEAQDAGLNLSLSPATPQACETLNRHRSRGAPLDCGKDASVGFIFSVRSTYEIIRYLGDVMRRAQYPDYARPPRVVAIKRDLLGSAPAAAAPAPVICDARLPPGAIAADGAECLALFAVRRGKAQGEAGAFASARYGGADYVIDTPPSGRSDREPTLEAFELLTELLALNRSAKDVPATTVFTVVPH